MMQFFMLVWEGITRSMSFDPSVAPYMEQRMEQGNASDGVVFVIAVLGGCGLLLGQSAILFANRVRPLRFFLSLVFNGVAFALGMIVWAVVIWAIGGIMFRRNVSLELVAQLIGLSAAPYVFGVLVLMPYFGEGIYRVLGIWSMLIATGAIAFSFGTSWFEALPVVSISWLLIHATTMLLARPFLRLRRFVQRLLVGTPLDLTVDDILLRYTSDASEPVSERTS